MIMCNELQRSVLFEENRGIQRKGPGKCMRKLTVANILSKTQTGICETQDSCITTNCTSGLLYIMWQQDALMPVAQ